MTLAEELLAAADDGSLPVTVRALVRRAAVVLLEAELDADHLALIREKNEAKLAPFGANDLLRDWLIAHGRLLDEDTETEGNA